MFGKKINNGALLGNYESGNNHSYTQHVVNIPNMLHEDIPNHYSYGANKNVLKKINKGE